MSVFDAMGCCFSAAPQHDRQAIVAGTGPGCHAGCVGCRDKSNPKSWHKAEGITLLPNPDTLTPTVVDRVRKVFNRS